MATNKIAFGIRLDPQIVERVKAIADSEDRSVSNLVAIWIKERLNA